MELKLARLGSPFFLVALLAFFLPFYGVSCQGDTVTSASGWELATSGFESGEEAPKRVRAALKEKGPEAESVWLLAFPLLAAAAAGCAFVGSQLGVGADAGRVWRGRALAAGGATGALLLLHYVWLSSRFRSALARATGAGDEDDAAAAMARGLGRMFAGGIELELHAGWWIALLAVVAGTGLLAAAWLRQPAAPVASVAVAPRVDPSI